MVTVWTPTILLTTAAPILPAVPTVKTSPVFIPAVTKLTVPLCLLISLSEKLIVLFLNYNQF